VAVSLLEEVNALHDSYLAWLRAQTRFKQIDSEWVEIATPLLDRHNDFLSIYVRKGKEGLELTDDSYVINDLRMSGCQVDKGQRAQFLRQTLMGFGVRREGDALTLRASTANFSPCLHSLLQAMLTVGNLFFTNSANVKKLFWEDVRDWFDENEVRYNPSIKVTGKSGYDHMFDFVIPKSRKYPERFIQTVNAPDKGAVSRALFSFLDISEVRSGARCYVILNDNDKSNPASALTAIDNYAFPSILWSKKDNFREELAA